MPEPGGRAAVKDDAANRDAGRHDDDDLRRKRSADAVELNATRQEHHDRTSQRCDGDGQHADRRRENRHAHDRRREQGLAAAWQFARTVEYQQTVALCEGLDVPPQPHDQQHIAFRNADVSALVLAFGIEQTTRFMDTKHGDVVKIGDPRRSERASDEPRIGSDGQFGDDHVFALRPRIALDTVDHPGGGQPSLENAHRLFQSVVRSGHADHLAGHKSAFRVLVEREIVRQRALETGKLRAVQRPAAPYPQLGIEAPVLMLVGHPVVAQQARHDEPHVG